MKRIIAISLFLILTQFASGQLPKIHSHNDYYQKAPFWLAYNAGASSIEIDVILKKDQLYIAHSESEIKPDATFESLYVKPLKQLSNLYEPIHQISYLVDIKTGASSTLKKLIEITEKYPLLFNNKPSGLKLIISGNRPDQKKYQDYPDYIYFDGRDASTCKDIGGDKIALISRNFSDFTSWKGEGKLSEVDSIKLQNFANECHLQKKQLRFWNTPDQLEVYQFLISIGVDFINTDHPFKLKEYLEKYDTQNSLPDWSEGLLDIHHINTGRGNATFVVFPDGTSMLIDMGDMSETHPRILSKRNAPAVPNRSKSPAQWVANYIRQFHPAKSAANLDYALITHYHDDHFGEIDGLKQIHQEGEYLLTGIMELGSIIPISVLADRGFEFPINLKDTAVWEKYRLNNDPYSMIETLQEYWKFIDYHTEKNDMVYEPFDVGSDVQFKPMFNPDQYKNFKIHSLFANGKVKNEKGEIISLFNYGEYPGENKLSAGIKINYGEFDYYTGADISGIHEFGEADGNSPETIFAPFIGAVDVATLNHHGNRDSQNATYVGTVKPRVWVQQGWSSDHPGEDVLRRITSRKIYLGERDIFSTSLLEANHLVIGGRVDKSYKSLSGHVVIRVYPGGKNYSVFVLNDKTIMRNIVSEHKYQSR